MNLLVTNAQDIQAYLIVRSLRDHAARVVVTFGSNSVGGAGFIGVAAFSRHVDQRYEVPAFADAWLSGQISMANTPAEETYVRRIEEICSREKIDVIYPSLDPEVYLFAKNKKRFADRGVLCVVPEYDILQIPANKALTLAAAERSGFPIPATFYPKSVDELDAVTAQVGPPWVVKARYSAHRNLLRFAEDEQGLRDAFTEMSAVQPEPLVQEFIGGTNTQHYYVTVGRDGRMRSVLSPQTVRTYREGNHYAVKTIRSKSTAPYLEELRNLVSRLGLWGAYTIQSKIDPSDGTPRLMEINARFGHHLWFRTELGVNEPLMVLRMARGEDVEPQEFPEGVLLLDPFHDIFYLAHCFVESAARAVGRPPRLQNDASISQAFRELRADYWNRSPKAYCPEFRYLLDDPYPMLRKFLSTLALRIRGRTPKRILGGLRQARNRLSGSHPRS